MLGENYLADVQKLIKPFNTIRSKRKLSASVLELLTRKKISVACVHPDCGGVHFRCWHMKVPHYQEQCLQEEPVEGWTCLSQCWPVFFQEEKA